MHQRKKALREVSVASPSSGSKITSFNRFKEGSFKQVLGLAAKLHTKGWGAIVGSDKVKERLEAEGLSNVVYEPKIANKNEIILNRAKDSGESNFFVFVKFDTLKATAFFTDPTHGSDGRKLKRRELMRKKSVFRAKNKTWTEETANEITQVAAKKANCKFFGVVHGHWGENWEHGKNRDDGVSMRKDIIRQFMLWHYDVDATGYHNWIHLDAIRDISEREANVGIRKVPSLEFTMPFNDGAENGPHLNFWFADLKTAEEFWRKYILGNKHNVMPGLAANVKKREILQYVNAKRRVGEMALGVAHPSCILNVVVNRLPVGLLNLLNERDREGKPKYNWKAIWSFVEKYADAVGEFNPTLEDYILRFQTQSTQRYFRRKVDMLVGRMNGYSNGNGDETSRISTGVDAEIRRNVKMTESSVSYAFAKRMGEKFGKITYMDHDLHVYGKTKAYGRFVSPLAYGRTVFRLNEAGMEKIREGGAIGGEDFVEMMHKKTFRGEAVKAGTETFLELDGGKLRPVAPRRDIFYDIRNLKSNFSHGWLNVKLAWKDLKKRYWRSVSTEA